MRGTYRVVSVEEAAAALGVGHALALAHHEARRALAALHAGSDLTAAGGSQVGAGGGARRHAGGVDAVWAAGHGWGGKSEKE